jgi:hypothetical protein
LSCARITSNWRQPGSFATDLRVLADELVEPVEIFRLHLEIDHEHEFGHAHLLVSGPRP